jgi:hypothetical protein
MSDSEENPEQQKKEAEKKERGSYAFAAKWAKQQYEACKTYAGRYYKKLCDAPWWFKEKDPVAKFTGWVAAYTGVLVLVATLQLCTLNSTDRTTNAALIAANRAWVGPIAATMSNPVKDQPLTITVQYQNTGREPALNVAGYHSSDIYSVEDWNNGNAAKAIEDFAAVCLKFDSASDIQVVYPNTGNSSYTGTFKTNEAALNTHKYLVTDNLIAGKEIYATQGCFSYVTLHQHHHSAFCYYYWTETALNPPSMSICNIGNNAD